MAAPSSFWGHVDHGELLRTCCSWEESEAVKCAADPNGSFSLFVGLCYACLADGFGKSPPGLGHGHGLLRELLLGSVTVVRSRL